jgi:hypothetical protein
MDKPPPLTWLVAGANIVSEGLTRRFEANAAEREAVAAYLGCLGIEALEARVTISPLSRGRFRLQGTVKAILVRQSVVTLEEVRETIEEQAEADFWPRGQIQELAGNAEFSASAEEDEPEAMEDGDIPAGRLVCEILAVSMDPYPRIEGESFVPEPSGNEAERPFAVLERLKTLK